MSDVIALPPLLRIVFGYKKMPIGVFLDSFVE